MFKFLILLCIIKVSLSEYPIVIGTWGFSLEPCQIAWDLLNKGYDGIEALEAGCSYCEREQCDSTVGFGGSPDENGETTLDALIFDGRTMNVGAVAGLRRIKNVVSVAKHVLKHTKHSMLVGDQATEFAKAMGFKEESLSTNTSIGVWDDWKNGNCQPNYWINVEPNPSSSCGPYNPINENNVNYESHIGNSEIDVRLTHDTIGMVLVDHNGDIIAGTSTNGLRHKIAGRVGDSPIPGAGAYADSEVGGAAATGDGDTMIRFLPSLLAVEAMRRGATPEDASNQAILRMTKHYPSFSGAVIAVNKNGEFGASCNGMDEFPFAVMSESLKKPQIFKVACVNNLNKLLY
ncbi:N(4)-(Beta-N-acetylglucosaminyl)-L-asparaginase-like [Onthophagus taurus]|uniref:N(4)-(Beta-N-acetylglucosaminyl)-L-asparaginase- like n=1 Tax=Onthophagus taurus TaxID=166361 RepID=UPI0039BEC187